MSAEGKGAMKRRVVVTGLGCVCPVGNSVASTWDGLMKGASGVAGITLFQPTGFPARIAAEVKNFERDFPDLKARYPYAGRNSLFALAAGRHAVEASGILDAKYDPSRIGVYTGGGEGPPDFMGTMDIIARSQLEGDRCDLTEFIRLSLAERVAAVEWEQEPMMVPAYLAGEFGFQGPNLNTLTACAAAAQAIGESAKLIEDGTVDAVLTGGSSSMIHPFGITSFCLLTTLATRNDDPTRASRPFDRDRSGFVLGEGAGMLVLEEYESAKRRGANILAEVKGYGSTADAYRVTDIHPEGRGAAEAMRQALRDARLNPEDIGYVNAHGTSTKANDSLETRAIHQAFGESAKKLQISSTKSMTGHLVAASGGIEAVFSILALQKGVLPPTTNYETPDPECDLDCIPNQPREVPVQNVLSNSFGFGGQNISLVFSKV